MEALADFFDGRHNLMRAITLFARSQPNAVDGVIPERRGIQQSLVDLLAAYADEITSPDPERSIRMGLFVATSAIREIILFPSAPFAAATGETAASIKKEVAAMLYSYLRGGEQNP